MDGSRTPSRRPLFPTRQAALGLALLLTAAPAAPAAVPADAQTRARVIGQPVALSVQPPTITLAGPKSMLQVLVTGRYADGSVRDLTHFCELALETTGLANLDEDRFLL